MGGLGLCKCSVFYMCDHNTDTITEQKSKYRVNTFMRMLSINCYRDGKIKLILKKGDREWTVKKIGLFNEGMST